MITSALKWLLDHVPVALIPPQFQLALSLLRGLVPLLGYIGGFIAWSWSAIRVFDRGTPPTVLTSPPCAIQVLLLIGRGVTLTATWLLPIAIIPGTWQVYEVPATPPENTRQITGGQTSSQPESRETDDPVSDETREDDVTEEKVLDENVPEPRASTSQEPGQDNPWGSPSSSHTSRYQPSQGYWDPNLSSTWVHPEHGYPNSMYSSSGSFQYAQSHYPPGAYFTPMSGYATPMYGYGQPTNPERTPETHEQMTYEAPAPPPVVVKTVPLPT